MNLDDREWKEFIVEDIFEVDKKPRLINKKTKSGDEVDYITCSLQNQGVVKTIKTPDEKFIVEGNKITVTIGGQPGGAFYRENDYCTSEVLNLDLKNEDMNRNIGIFLSICITKLKAKYNYGYQLTLNRLKKEKIWIPVDTEEKIDYHFMEDYVSEVQNKLLPNDFLNLKKEGANEE